MDAVAVVLVGDLLGVTLEEEQPASARVADVAMTDSATILIFTGVPFVTRVVTGE
jgi:hypothetical protein